MSQLPQNVVTAASPVVVSAVPKSKYAKRSTWKKSKTATITVKLKTEKKKKERQKQKEKKK